MGVGPKLVVLSLASRPPNVVPPDAGADGSWMGWPFVFIPAATQKQPGFATVRPQAGRGGGGGRCMRHGVTANVRVSVFNCAGGATTTPVKSSINTEICRAPYVLNPALSVFCFVNACITCEVKVQLIIYWYCFVLCERELYPPIYTIDVSKHKREPDILQIWAKTTLTT